MVQNAAMNSDVDMKPTLLYRAAKICNVRRVLEKPFVRELYNFHSSTLFQ